MSEFADDLSRALRAWQQSPLLPVFSCVLALIQAELTVLDVSSVMPRALIAWLASLAVGAFWIGSLGTERVWYLRAFNKEPMRLLDAWLLSWRYLGRFLHFGLRVAWRFALLWLAALALFVLARRAGGTLPWWYYAGTLICVLPIFVATTFAMPALTYATRSPLQALHIGWAVVRTFWPETALYVLLPPLLYVVAAREASPLIVISTLLNLLFKGAAASFFLRYRDGADEALA